MILERNRVFGLLVFPKKTRFPTVLGKT
jgi:hypothetical protein